MPVQRLLSLAAVLVAALGLPASTAKAAGFDVCISELLPPPKNLNVCERLLEELVVETLTPRIEESCVSLSAWECLSPGVAECCIPGVCMTFPHCVVARTVQEVVTTVYHRDDIYCDFREISPTEAFSKMVAGLYVDPDTGEAIFNPYELVGAEFLVETLEAHIAAMECAASPLPSGLKSLVSAMQLNAAFSPFGDAAPFDTVDVDRMVLLGDAEQPAKAINKKTAITLDRLVIVEQRHFDTLMGQAAPSLLDLQLGNVDAEYMEALDLLIHELVHVRQYREAGTTQFLADYLAAHSDIRNGYFDLPQEHEAYGSASLVASGVGGAYCESLVGYYEWVSDQTGADMRVGPCRPVDLQLQVRGVLAPADPVIISNGVKHAASIESDGTYSMVGWFAQPAEFFWGEPYSLSHQSPSDHICTIDPQTGRVFPGDVASVQCVNPALIQAILY